MVFKVISNHNALCLRFFRGKSQIHAFCSACQMHAGSKHRKSACYLSSKFFGVKKSIYWVKNGMHAFCSVCWLKKLKIYMSHIKIHIFGVRKSISPIQLVVQCKIGKIWSDVLYTPLSILMKKKGGFSEAFFCNHFQVLKFNL